MAHFRQTNFAVWLSLALYLIASSLGVAHAAKFGDSAHDHYGQACSVKHIVEEDGYALVPNDPDVVVLISAIETPLQLTADLSNPFAGTNYQTRAPPIINQF